MSSKRPRVEVTIKGDNRDSIREARDIIDRALTAGGFPPAQRPRHLRLVSGSSGSSGSRGRRR